MVGMTKKSGSMKRKKADRDLHLSLGCSSWKYVTSQNQRGKIYNNTSMNKYKKGGLKGAVFSWVEHLEQQRPPMTPQMLSAFACYPKVQD